VTLPVFCFGEVHLVVVVDPDGAITQHPPGPREASVEVQCQSVPTPDLVATALIAEVSQPGLIELTWTVANQGQTVSGTRTWLDICLLSTLADVTDPAVTTYTLGTYEFTLPLVGGDTWSNTRFAAVPLTLPLGDYYIMCTVDGTNRVPETDETNNAVVTTTSLSITAPSNSTTPWTDAGIDLTIEYLPGTLVVGRSRLSVDFTVRNEGTDPTHAPTWFDALVLSNDTTYDPAVDYLLYPSRQYTGAALGPMDEYNVTDMTVEIPRALVGQFAYVFVVADIGAMVSDYDRSNNFALVTPTPLNLSAVGLSNLASAGSSSKLHRRPH
jgi:hypothetical protein